MRGNNDHDNDNDYDDDDDGDDDDDNSFINNPIDPSLVTDTTGCGICPNTIYNISKWSAYFYN